jgi:hypothetical protein
LKVRFQIAGLAEQQLHDTRVLFAEERLERAINSQFGLINRLTCRWCGRSAVVNRHAMPRPCG